MASDELRSGGDGGTSPVDGGRITDAGADQPDASVDQRDASSETPDAGQITVDAGPERIGLFVANGHMGRTIVSCDDGRTWRDNQSDFDDMSCFAPGGNPDGGSSDCDHNPSAGHGVVFSNGTYVAAYGWGYPGSVRTSRNGVQWQHTLEGVTLSTLVKGAGRTILGSGRLPRWSDDDGATWHQGNDIEFKSGENQIWNVRAAAYSKGVYAMYAQDGANREMQISIDGGQGWKHATMPTECGAAYSVGFISGAGQFLFVDQKTACISPDGNTFTSAPLPGIAESGPVWTGSEFMVWGFVEPSYARVAMRSTDGVEWTVTPLATRVPLPDGGTSLNGAPVVGAVGVGDNGTMVMINGGWNAWYEKQTFYRSTDGLIWELLPKTAYVGSHPMGRIAWGLVERSTTNCP